MSSAVNKSSTRFAPKVNLRGTAVRSQQRRLSVVGSTVPPPVRPVGRESTRLRGLSSKPVQRTPIDPTNASLQTPVIIPGEGDPDAEDSSAIIDDDEPEPVPSDEVNEPRKRRRLSESTQAKASQQSSDKAGEESGDHVELRTISARISNLRGGTEPDTITPEEPRLRKTVVTIPEEEPPAEEENADATVEDGSSRTTRANAVTDTMEFFNPAEDGSSRESTPRAVRRDSRGRVLLDPDDLPKFGRGYRKFELAEADSKAINVETFTMAHLCKELPLGRKNEEYDKYEAARKKRKEARERLLQIKKRAKRQGVPYADIDELRHNEEERRAAIKEEQESRLDKFFRNGKAPGLHLKLGQDGQIEVDETSTQVDRHVMMSEVDASRERSDYDKYQIVTNSASYSLREKPERWDEPETTKFYQAISMWGTDFNLIAHMFPGRSRRQIKTKFKLEERRNPAKIHLAIMRRLPVDLESFSESTGATINSVEEIEKELEALRAKHEEILKAEEDARDKARREDAANAERKETERFGGAVKKDEEVVKVEN